MKKMIAMAAVAILMMSCSGDDSESTENPGTNGQVPVKIIENGPDGIITSEFTYNGNKLTKAVYDDGTKSEFFYNDDKLSKIKYYWEDEDTASEEEHFFYNAAGKLSHYIEYVYDPEFGETWAQKTVFTYNSNNTIATKIFSGDADSQTELQEEGLITMQNGNVVSYVNEWDTTQYTYDNKNAIDKNVFGFDVLAIAYFEGGVNNILTEMDSEDEGTHEYTYNDDNYPITETVDYGGGDVYTYEYFYE